MRIIIMGAGIIGTSTAWHLQRRGHEVLLVEGQGECVPKKSASFANGGQITASESMPWAGPKIWAQVFSFSHSFQWRVRFSMAQWRFLFSFLANCRASAQWAGFHDNLALACASIAEMERMEKLLAPLDYKASQGGILQLYRDKGEMEQGGRLCDALQEAGQGGEMLGAGELAKREPYLASGEYAGALFAPQDRVGDARLFAERIIGDFKEKGGRVMVNSPVKKLHSEQKRIRALYLRDGSEIEGDVFIAALGVATPHLLAPLGVRLPIYPLKGYSLSLGLATKRAVLSASLTDPRLRMVVTQLGSELRIAGLAEIGFSPEADPSRKRQLLDGLENILPDICYDRSSLWAGERPMTPDGSPIIGRAGAFENLFINAGHGSLGWTLSQGSAQMICEMIDGEASRLHGAFSPQRKFIR